MTATENYASEKTVTTDSKGLIIRAYKQRWLILIIYILYATLSTLQWVQYSIITDVIMKYYSVSASDVNWTSMIFSLMWPVLVFPTSFIIDRMVCIYLLEELNILFTTRKIRMFE